VQPQAARGVGVTVADYDWTSAAVSIAGLNRFLAEKQLIKAYSVKADSPNAVERKRLLSIRDQEWRFDLSPWICSQRSVRMRLLQRS